MTLNIVRDQMKNLAADVLRRPAIAPFKAAPIMPPNPTDPRREVLRKTHKTAVANWLYINRREGEDRFGPLPSGYMAKADDLIDVGRRHPLQKFPPQYRSGPLIWEEADAAAAIDPEDAAGVHIVASLPGMVPDQWLRLVERFIDENFITLGMVVDWAIHAKRDEDGGWATHPHVHMIASARRFRKDMRQGQRQKTWLHSASQINLAEDAWLAATGLQPLPLAA